MQLFEFFNNDKQLVEGGLNPIDAIREIAQTNQNEIVKFEDGSIRVDAFTARAMMAVYDKINDANKQKISTLIKTRPGFEKFANFVFTKASSSPLKVAAESGEINEIFGLSAKEKAAKAENELKAKFAEAMKINNVIEKANAVDELALSAIAAGKGGDFFRSLGFKSRVEYPKGWYQTMPYWQGMDTKPNFGTVYGMEALVGPITPEREIDRLKAKAIGEQGRGFSPGHTPSKIWAVPDGYTSGGKFLVWLHNAGLSEAEVDNTSESSQWGEPEDILRQVLQTLERDVEWPLTDVMDPQQVKQLLSPLMQAVSQQLNSLDEAEVDNTSYQWTHGKRPSGEGSWFFVAHKGGVDFKNDVEGEDYISVHGMRYADAKKAALDWAKKKGHARIYVGEDNSANESYGSAIKKAESSRQRAIKRAAASYKNHGDMDRAIRDNDLFAKDAERIRQLVGEGKSENRELWDKIKSKGVVPDIDRERYTDLSDEGLEGPFRMKNGQVLYYDPKEGKYYNRDTDMYVDYDDYVAMNEMDKSPEANPYAGQGHSKHEYAAAGGEGKGKAVTSKQATKNALKTLNKAFKKD
jgi:hypothetical protein